MPADIAKAYVQIVPSAQGMKGKLNDLLSGDASSAGKSAGNSIGSNLVSTLTKVISVAAIGKFVSDALFSGADLQQSMGGIETIFKDSAETMRQYATQAYQTAGVSANDYMEQATSFSASLLQSLNGDTAKAAEVANMAIIDMSDNANKMGTSLESIQNAYQGFAKQNYTMLDNLKLGYGGTKSEMERLLADAEKLTGIKYDINNLDDVYNAIHVIQGELGITGTTALEAKETFSGSFQTMKAAGENFMASLTGVATGSGEAILSVQDSMTALVESASTFLFGNLLPMVGNLVVMLPQAIGSGLQAAIPILMEQGSAMIDTLRSGVIANIPNLVSTASEIISNLASYIQTNFPTIVSTGLSLVAEFTGAILQNLPQLLQAGVQLLVALGQGILASIPSVVSFAFQVCGQIVQAFFSTDWVSVGANILNGIGSGIASAIGGLISTAVSACKSLLSSVKGFFGIASPSKLFRDQIGAYIPQGLAVGIENNLGYVNDAMEELEKATIGGIDTSVNLSSSRLSTNGGMERVINLLEQLVANPTIIEMNDRELGRSLKRMGVEFA